MVQHLRALRSFPVIVAALLAGATMSVARAQDAATEPAAAPQRAPQDEQVQPHGQVIEGTVNPYTYEPKELVGDTALRELMESMGGDAIEWFQHVQTLSNPFFEGRAPGSRGSVLTHEYVEFWMKKLGLEPAFPAQPNDSTWTSYRQEWMLPGSSAEVRTAVAKQGARVLVHGEDFQVMGSSGSGTITAPLAFAGYGIEDGPDGYTSFAEEADFTGHIVILLRYEPINDEGRSRWAPRRFSEHSAIARKLDAVARRNPAAIILVNPPGAIDGRSGLETTQTSSFGRTRDIPFIQLSRAAADALLRDADPQARSLEDLRVLADEGEVTSFALRSDRPMTIEVEVENVGTLAANIGGVVRGKGSLAEQWIIVGAHIDHVGYGYFGTSPAYRGQLHPGADDNASGTAAMLITARKLKEWIASDQSPDDVRSFLFLGFDAEESGLRGSVEYTRAPTLSLESIQAMINLDMVGRMRNNELSVSGVGSAEGFLDLIRPTFESSGLTVRADPSGRGPSDHASFYAVGVPVLFLFTGSHPDYHRPADLAYRTNPAGAVRLIGLTEALSRQLATQPNKLVFQSTARTAGRDRGYAAVRLGIQPGLVEGGEGVKIESVSEGTSAAEAGIEPGDVLLAWDGTLVESVGSMMEQMRSHQPGDRVTLRIRRGEEVIEVPVTLKAAQRRSGE
ncbi:MAG: M28 family peptidase [Phycisphaeraceae bacterium]|nr:M28 family peptidase [Phycisphaeraceae bacterium]